MDTEELLKELRPLANQREIIVEKIKSQNLPVILYGAAEKARNVTKGLKCLNVPIAGYVVDKNYYHDGMTYLGLPVFNLAELSKEPKKYIFVIAMENETAIEKFVQNENLTICHLDIESKNVEHINYNYIEEHIEQFVETYNHLSDDISRDTFLTYLKIKISGDVQIGTYLYDANQYFNDVTARFTQMTGGGVFADCGAYRGDTIEEFIDWTNGNYKKIYAIEADKDNFAALNEFVKSQGHRNIESFNIGAWNKRDTLYFNNESSTASSINSEGNQKIDVDALDSLITDGKVDFIKMDIEGAELPALQGAAELIKNNKPYLAICVYHKERDLITIPQYIKELNKNYKLYLRKHKKYLTIELVLYAIP